MNMKMAGGGIRCSRERINPKTGDKKLQKEVSAGNCRDKILSAFMALMLLAGISSCTLAGDSESGTGGREPGMDYMSYQGPVLPLMVAGDAEGLTAKRGIDFDFSPYILTTETYDYDGEIRTYDSYAHEAIVTDNYVIANNLDGSVQVTGIYPFAGSFSSAVNIKPDITVEGTSVETGMHAGSYIGGFLESGEEDGDSISPDPAPVNSWKGYRDILETGEYMKAAFEEYPRLDQPVTVYEFTEAAYPEDTDAVNPMLSMEFYIDYSETTILTYGMNGGRWDPDSGYGSRHFSVPGKGQQGYGSSIYLLVLGEDIGEYNLQGYVDGGCREDGRLEGVSAVVNRYESSLGEILVTIMEQNGIYGYIRDGDDMSMLSAALPEGTFFGAVAELMYSHGVLSDEVVPGYEIGMLEDVFSEVHVMDRIIYLTFDMHIPAGESIEVSASMVKKAGMDFYGDTMDRNGYDMLTRSGSNLDFTSLSASIREQEHVQILAQNFDFDPSKGITELSLDPDKEHYYLEVKRAD